MYNIHTTPNIVCVLLYWNNYQFTEHLSHAYHSQSDVRYHRMYIQKYDIKIKALYRSFLLCVSVSMTECVWRWNLLENKAHRITVQQIHCSTQSAQYPFVCEILTTILRNWTRQKKEIKMKQEIWVHRNCCLPFRYKSQVSGKKCNRSEHKWKENCTNLSEIIPHLMAYKKL